ncbi:hypothetical protein BDY17DRAFT_252876 [Neohortaea acidophila]|uniref:Signal recognition particle subunit SRP72 n=1 Tax=Neohortaea acidophila TaxID=245834 RepID=A0A6A6PQH7_9PEZI|nr:uncharacterized protein BDY17DRAFT_252876 [Neohortaea acidophila]KAF2481693.1 hypothetical protein BDY17DRAFT_252876 [Neohortaea acidophila]
MKTLSALLQRSDIEDHQQVLQASDAALKENKADLNTQHIKAIALLKLDRYEDAVKVLEAGAGNLKDEARLEYAYALYKSGNAAKAAEVAQQGADRGCKHVEAQSRYRAEDFQRAFDLYAELASDLREDADLDLRINSAAVDAQRTWDGSDDLAVTRKAGRQDLDVFETAYNAACGSIARGELLQAEVLLKRAHNLCNALEDMTDDEKEAEMLPIIVQQAYVLAKLGRFEEAERLSQSIDVKSIPDSSTQRIARVNRAASRPSSSNPFETQRLISGNVNPSATDRPFEFQASILHQNRYAVDSQSVKFDGAVESTNASIAKQPAPTLDPHTNSLAVVNAAARARNTTGKEALKHILPHLQKRPNDVGLILTIVQLYILTGNSSSAITLLEGFLSRVEQAGTTADLDVLFAPGLVGAMVGLYHREHRKSHIQHEFAKAATHWRRKSKTYSAGVTNLLKAAGSVLLESEDPEHGKLAADIFTALHDQDPADRYTTAGLLAAAPTTSSSSQTSSLTPISTLTAGIDVAALENHGIATPSTGAQVAARKRPAPDTSKTAKAAKKIRKSRLPKDYDPKKTPDPERWLPLRDRSSYRPPKGGKKGKARLNALSQGAAPSGDGSDASRPGTPGGEVVKAKQTGGGGGKKKKAKGR